MEKIKSKIPFNYKTIKVTQSRLNKGLLAVPVSLIDYFPKQKGKIYISTGTGDEVNTKTFTPYTSSSRECRIGGMRDFYQKFQIKDGDEIVVQMLDDSKYRLLPEKQFEDSIKRLENEFDKSQSEDEAELKLQEVSKITGSELRNTVFNEYYRLINTQIEKRKYKEARLTRKKETATASIKKILTEIYKGKCQLTGFTFTMRNRKPYFEIHHIKPDLGNHIKNLLVVSPNVHAQFTYAYLEEFFDQDGWLRRVRFNGEEFSVNHIIDKIPKTFEKEIHLDL